ncbi:AraC family transcriptional regulator [Enterocloster bolteae]|uniref:AraC family transcriptional regulator n=1 Tax=Enterocloster bolteae TaxID=208479 RepID=UPI0029106EEB|nr:AraC family transcriptional regulator [Enterocloster bolteae]MDU3285486.1 AraC family transcriptional regulator [Enterocloster bolteae]
MQLNYLEVNGNLEEVTCHGTPAFPMEVYLDDLDLYPNRSIPWHWHKELELVYVLRGAIEFQTGVRSYVLSSGQGGLLPPNMLHMVAPYHHQRGSAYCAVLADPYLLHGLSGGLVEAQCASFITGADVDFFLLDNTCPWHKEALSCIHDMYLCDCRRPPGYLWRLQILLQQTGLTLYENMDLKREKHTSYSDVPYRRVRSCLTFIHQEYARKIRLEDIARAASVSTSECCRDFKEILGQSPVDYLISYRVRMGEYLLTHTGKSILEIALAAGFSGSSHFSNTFTRYMGYRIVRQCRTEIVPVAGASFSVYRTLALWNCLRSGCYRDSGRFYCEPCSRKRHICACFLCLPLSSGVYCLHGNAG